MVQSGALERSDRRVRAVSGELRVIRRVDADGRRDAFGELIEGYWKPVYKHLRVTWRIDDDWVTRAKYYGSQMLDKKQIRQLPDYNTFINSSFMKSA